MREWWQNIYEKNMRQYYSITKIPSYDLWNNNSLLIENYEMAQLVFAHICHNAYFVDMYEMEIAQLSHHLLVIFHILEIQYSTM